MSTKEKTTSEAIAFRRSVRVYKSQPIDAEKVENCIQNAVLAPNSSNLQLWEFYHITDRDKLSKVSEACFNQPAAKTAQQLVVVVVRRDLWKKRAKANADMLRAISENPGLDRDAKKKLSMSIQYYKKLIPFIYSDVFGVYAYLKFLFFQLAGIFKPVYRQLRRSDLRVVAHKSAALAAQNFMLSMAAVDYDTCPMEGYDSLRVKRILKIDRKAEVNMIIGCGIRDQAGVYGKRYRVPFNSVYKQV